MDATLTGAPTPERGSVLVVVVLLSLGMFAVAHGLLLSAQANLTTARSGARLAERGAVSDGAIADLIRRGPPPEAGNATLAESWPVVDSAGSVSIEGTWRRVGAEAWLLSAAAPNPAGTLVSTGSRLVWWPEPVVRIRALPATVSVGPDAVTPVVGTIRSISLAEERAATGAILAEACDPIWASWATGDGDDSTGDGATGGASPPAVGTIAMPALGRFDVERLLTRAAALPSDRGTTAPSTLGGSCALDDPWNWGDPERPAAPCADHFVLMGSRTSLTLDGGPGQGVLVVDGDLQLQSDARFHGLVVVTGAVRLVDTATLTGFVIAGAGLETAGEAAVVRSVCRAVRALAGVRAALGATTLHPALDFIPR